jgi:hypothetical protein
MLFTDIDFRRIEMKKVMMIFAVLISALIYAEADVLTESEAEGILLIREEEKLARDVYSFLYEKWEIPIFRNISQSEQKHMDEIGRLITQYGLTDPATGEEGIFNNIEIQNLYYELIGMGSTDLVSALKTGAIIEDLDIADLSKLLLETDKEDIRIVFLNLEKGSRNHLRSFYSQIIRRGGQYSPEFISEDYFARIITSDKETGMEIDDPLYIF